MHTKDQKTEATTPSVAAGSECAALKAQDKIPIGEWPGNVMVRLQLPVPVLELADILNVLSKRAQGEGRQARMRQVGTILEVFTIPNSEISNAARIPNE
jgi:hypothetical protein